MITDQVIATRTYGLFFGAEILRISSLIDGTPYEMFHSTDLNWELENPNSKQYAYIISGTEVYQQIELDFKDLKARVSESGPHKYPLIYDFPFLNETGFSCWYDGTGEGGDCRIDRDNDWWWNGFYNVEEGPSPLKTPAGSFENCYMIKMAVQGGGRCQWFCLNIGIAGSTWTYQHQVPNHYPLTGYEIKLLSYSLIE